MTVDEIKKLISQPTTRVVEQRAVQVSPRGPVLKYSLYDGNNKLLLVATGVHGNVMIPVAQRDIWELRDGNAAKINLDWAEFMDVFGMLGVKNTVQQQTMSKSIGR